MNVHLQEKLFLYQNYVTAYKGQASLSAPIAKEYVHKVNQQNVAISEIEHIFANGNIAYYTCLLLPCFCKSPFFDHSNDHYSMMHLVEACRQAAIAIPHKFYAVPVVGFYYMIKRLDVRMIQFFEKDLNVRLFCKTTLVKNTEMQKSFEVEFDLMQGQYTQATICGDTYVLNKKLYKKIR